MRNYGEEILEYLKEHGQYDFVNIKAIIKSMNLSNPEILKILNSLCPQYIISKDTTWLMISGTSQNIPQTVDSLDFEFMIKPEGIKYLNDMNPKTIYNNIDQSGNTGIIQDGHSNTASQYFNFSNNPHIINMHEQKDSPVKIKSRIAKIWGLISENKLVSGIVLAASIWVGKAIIKNWDIIMNKISH